MWRHCLLLALANSSAVADTADAKAPTEELIDNTEANLERGGEGVESESGLISLHSKDFAPALQSHPLLMVCLFW